MLPSAMKVEYPKPPERERCDAKRAYFEKWRIFLRTLFGSNFILNTRSLILGVVDDVVPRNTTRCMHPQSTMEASVLRAAEFCQNDSRHLAQELSSSAAKFHG
jgi:hypothetical protein